MKLPVVDASKVSQFDRRLKAAGLARLGGLSIETVQVNIGLRCNLACRHCHVESSPARREEMTWQTMEMVLSAAQRAGVTTIDITGGAPEMHPQFRRFVNAAIEQKFHVMVRTNLTIMLEDGYRDLPTFYAQRHIHLVASMPCYLETNVDRQRGKHVYQGSVDVLQRLNAVGYGRQKDLALDLVYNPGGPSLPPSQHELEEVYRRELESHFNIHFSQLYTITNLPIGRFMHDLERQGKAGSYEQLLQDNFNTATLDKLMCRHQLHVGWDGTTYDCDFNYALGLPSETGHISHFDPHVYLARRIVTADHCFGCTAGCGSSCGGSLTDGTVAADNKTQSRSAAA
jgi:radical SAM/Cys-rich protein